jgi:hypothetical protein
LNPWFQYRIIRRKLAAGSWQLGFRQASVRTDHGVQLMRVLAALMPLLLLVPAMVLGYKAGPGPRVTGGFGEPTCAQCHQGQPPSDRALTVDVPESYRAGQTYRVMVTISRPGLEVGGFELAARYRSGPAVGKQAGGLEATDERTQVVEDAGVLYAQHTDDGARARPPGKLAWVVVWRAPAEPAGEVVFHVAANAANGDASALGDRIYAAEAVTRPAPAPTSPAPCCPAAR